MIEQRGVVIGLDGENAVVRVGGQSGCPACDEGRGCGAGLFGRLLRRGDAQVRVVNRLRAHPGDGVVLGLRETDYLSLVMRLYGWPLAAGLVGAGVAVALLSMVTGVPGWVVDAAAGLAALTMGGVVLVLARNSLAGRFGDLSLEMTESASRLDCASIDRTE